MTDLPQLHQNWRSPRVRITESTPVVLRLPDGGRHRGKLETISLTGGLLSLPHVLNRGSHISLMFLTRSGPVSGTAEMLGSVSTEQQPFRFVALDRDNQRRLRTIVQPLLNPDEDVWIAKYRAAQVRYRPMRGVFSRILRGLFPSLHSC
jgi:PilZ domain